jgi:mono/diheme cytochrome c family protein
MKLPIKPTSVGMLLSGAVLCISITLANAQDKASGNQCGENENKNARIYAELGKAPEKARNRANPLENDPEAVAAGRLLFEDHCAECHGETAQGGKGRKKGPNLRAPEVQNATPGTLFWLLTNGVVRKGMPVWSKLPEPQRWQLVRYLKSLGVGEPALPETPAAKP